MCIFLTSKQTYHSIDGIGLVIHAQKSKEAARDKAIQIAEKLRSIKLIKAAKKVEDGIEETLTYMDFPIQHRAQIRINNAIKRLR